MHSRDAKWSITFSSDLYLNFMIYVGYLIGCQNVNTNKRPWPKHRVHTDASLQEAYWQSWQALIHAKVDNHRMDKTVWAILTHPEFAEIQDLQLRSICMSTWPDFLDWWYMPAGGQYAMYYWESAPQVNQFVREYESAIGRQVKPFRLDIDLVYGGKQIEHPVPGYMVIPVDGISILKREWWLALFASLEI